MMDVLNREMDCLRERETSFVGSKAMTIIIRELNNKVFSKNHRKRNTKEYTI